LVWRAPASCGQSSLLRGRAAKSVPLGTIAARHRKNGAWFPRDVEAGNFAVTILVDSKVANCLVRGRNVGREGVTMQTNLSYVRELRFAACACVAACWALWPSAGQAFTQEDQRRLCTGDVLRLCSSEIPDVERITACMRRQRANLSEGCRSVFGKPAHSASAR